MKYKITFKIERIIEFEDVKDLKVKSWDAINKAFTDCIFNNKGEEEQFITREKIN